MFFFLIYHSFFYIVDAGGIQRNKEIGTIDKWGPTFSVSFDLIIHSYVRGKGKQGWTSVLAFKGNGGKSHCCKHGDRIPDVALNKNGELRFTNSVSGNKKYQFIFNVDLNKWYNITIEQTKNDQKVTKIISVFMKRYSVLSASLIHSHTPMTSISNHPKLPNLKKFCFL